MSAGKTRTNQGGSMRQLGFSLAAIVIAGSFVGCPLLKKKAAAEEEQAPVDAALASVSGTGAKNESSVLRYANETALPNEPAVIGKDGAHARNFPGNGPEVAFLPKGTPVAKIAQYFSTGVLIMFDDPSGDSTKLIGWVAPKVFDVAAPAPPKPVVVPPRAVDAGAAKDAAAPAVPDAGTITGKDAGAPSSVDAGGGSSSKIPPPPKGALAVPPVDGKCYEGWVVESSMCRRKCASDADCPTRVKCVAKKAGKVCTSDL